jgi:hypothetical protein
MQEMLLKLLLLPPTDSFNAPSETASAVLLLISKHFT